MAQALTPRLNKYIPHVPTPPQAAFMLLDCREALYGGAAGGGKSDALLMDALQYVDVPGYAAILFRRTYADLTLPEALMARAEQWLAPHNDVRWLEKKKQWLFPAGATLGFGYLEHEDDKYRYQGAAFQYIGFDELTQFTESQYRYLFSRRRRLRGVNIPVRTRAASNPGGLGHDWVKRRMIDEGPKKGRIFVPARLADNPYLDREEYTESLNELDIVTRQQLLEGDWEIREKGPFFDRSWFEIVEDAPAEAKKNVVRWWDLAATEQKAGNDPDWTAGVKMGEHDGVFYVFNVRRKQAKPFDVERMIKATAEGDTRRCPIAIEQEPGSGGKNTIDNYQRRVLKGYSVSGVRSTGPKTESFRPFSAAAQAGNVKLVRGDWITDFLDELESVPNGSHDDQADAASKAFFFLVSDPTGAQRTRKMVGL